MRWEVRTSHSFKSKLKLNTIHFNTSHAIYFRISQVTPKDKKLNLYVDWLRDDRKIYSNIENDTHNHDSYSNDSKNNNSQLQVQDK